MKNRHRKSQKEHIFLKYTYHKFCFLAFFLCLLWMPAIPFYQWEGMSIYHVMVNGVEVGIVDREDLAQELLWKARYQVASKREGFTFLQAEAVAVEEKVNYAELDEESVMISRIVMVLEDGIRSTYQEAYSVKVKDYMVNLASREEVSQLFQAAIDKYDSTGKFQVKLMHDPSHEYSVFTTVIETRQEEEGTEETSLGYRRSGVQVVLENMGNSIEENKEPEFDDFEYGVGEIDLQETVKVIEAFLPARQLDSLEEAVNHLVAEQEVPVEYTVVAGDTLSEISMKVNIPMEQIVAMNRDKLDHVNTPIHIGDKLIITVPEPELTVLRSETKYYEEIYDADTIYIDNNDWYTTQSVVLQQPSAGFRRIAVLEKYENDDVVERLILKEEDLKEAVPMIIERGTKIPPTYVKPLYGGRFSSGFGPRSAPTKGASTYHKGVDWSTPTGTSVFASCGGRVSKAGWASGYGYVVYIDHSDGRQTRYAHLSKVLVSVGQNVKQGEKIALSGSTGISSGPHVHFEILINGKQVDPLKYIQ